jgi:hypothetical protein
VKKILLLFLIIVVLVFGLYINKSTITNYTVKLLVNNRYTEIPITNKYKKDYNFLYVQDTNDFRPQNKQDLLNIYFTLFNSGWDKFIFYCGSNYNNCLKDVSEIASDDELLSHINNFVHPFNSYKQIKTQFDNTGMITIIVKKNYDDYIRKIVEKKAEEIFKEITTDDMTNEEKLKAAHDYIINNTKYDIDGLDKKDNTSSHDSYGVLFEGYGLCNGYSDTMALFLHFIGLKNYKIVSDNHIWNYVNLDDNWYHLDVSWNDPITEDREDVLDYTFYLVTTEKLEELSFQDHKFNKNIYLEAK